MRTSLLKVIGTFSSKLSKKKTYWYLYLTCIELSTCLLQKLLLFWFLFAFWLMFWKSHIPSVNHSPFPYYCHLEIISRLWSRILESSHSMSVSWKFIFLQSFLEPLSHFGWVSFLFIEFLDFLPKRTIWHCLSGNTYLIVNHSNACSSASLLFGLSIPKLKV